MKIVKTHRFNARVTALELGYGIIGRPLMNVLCYLVGNTLIDSGQSRMAAEMITLVRDRQIDRILLTHHHEDHSGNAGLIANICAAQVMGHSITAYKMQHIRPILPYQHFVWGQARQAAVSPLPVEIAADGYCLVPIHTPGHCKDHTVYLEPQHGWLFSGDLYLGERIKFFRSDERIDLQIQSLKTVLQHDFETLFCGHNPVLKGAKEKLGRKLTYLQEISATVCSLVSKGLPEKEILRRMDPRQDRFVKFVTMGNASFANMVRSAIHAT